MVCICLCGDSASGKSTLAKALASKLGDTIILETDRYHKWPRNNLHWDTMTQLNPEGNHIDMINSDVLELKNGKSIWRKEYDHTTGSFTEINEIKPAKNIIVCGLHVLMCPDDLYDLKIFLDPPYSVKYHWKTTRDVEERGYTREQVENQIIHRKQDYKQFIEPLKEKADIILKSWTL